MAANTIDSIPAQSHQANPKRTNVSFKPSHYMEVGDIFIAEIPGRESEVPIIVVSDQIYEP